MTLTNELQPKLRARPRNTCVRRLSRIAGQTGCDVGYVLSYAIHP